MAGNVFFYFSVNGDRNMKEYFYFNDIIQNYHLPGKHAPDGKQAPVHVNFENFEIFTQYILYGKHIEKILMAT